MAMNKAMADLHRVDYKSLGLEDYGKSGSYFECQISRWFKQYEAAKDQAYPAMESLTQWLQQNIPDNDEAAIAHGDFRLDNMIIHPTESRILAVLDWELSTLGHPLSDFSYLCMPWRVPHGTEFGLDGLDLEAASIPREEKLVAAYCEQMGIEQIENWNYYLAFNFFRVAAISFGIMARVKDGTAAGKHAEVAARMAVPLSEMGLAQTKQ